MDGFPGAKGDFLMRRGSLWACADKNWEPEVSAQITPGRVPNSTHLQVEHVLLLEITLTSGDNSFWGTPLWVPCENFPISLWKGTGLA